MSARLAGRRLVLLGAGLGLAGCGFHPVYGSGGGIARQELGMIYVPVLPDRPGQLLRQALQQRLEGDGSQAKQFTLSVAYGISSDSISIQQDTSTTRVRSIGNATWTLKRLDPGQTLVTSGSARALDGLNVLDQQYFAADLESEAAQRRLADAIANQITLQLASYFHSHATAT